MGVARQTAREAKPYLGRGVNDEPPQPTGTPCGVGGSPSQGIPGMVIGPEHERYWGGYVASRPKGEGATKSLVAALVTVVVLALSAAASTNEFARQRLSRLLHDPVQGARRRPRRTRLRNRR